MLIAVQFVADTDPCPAIAGVLGGAVWGGALLLYSDNMTAPSLTQCQDTCQGWQECAHYTFAPATRACMLFGDSVQRPLWAEPGTLEAYSGTVRGGFVPRATRCMNVTCPLSSSPCKSVGLCDPASGACRYDVDVGAPCQRTTPDGEGKVGACDAAGECDLCTGNVACISADPCQQPTGVCDPATGSCSFTVNVGASCMLPDGTGTGVCDAMGGCVGSGGGARRALLGCTRGLRVIKNASPDQPVRIYKAPCQTLQLLARVAYGPQEEPDVDTDKEYMAKITFSCVTRVMYQCTTVPSNCGEAGVVYAYVTKEVPPVDDKKEPKGLITGYVPITNGLKFYVTQVTDLNCAYKACRRIIGFTSLLDYPCSATPGAFDWLLMTDSLVRFTGDVRATSCPDKEDPGTQYAYVEVTTGEVGWVDRQRLGMCGGCSAPSCDKLQPLLEVENGRSFIVGTYNTPWIDYLWPSPENPGNPERTKPPRRAFNDAQAAFGSKANQRNWWLAGEGQSVMNKVFLYIAASYVSNKPHSREHLSRYLAGNKLGLYQMPKARQQQPIDSQLPVYQLEPVNPAQSLLFPLDFYDMLAQSVKCDLTSSSWSIISPGCHFDDTDWRKADDQMFSDVNALMRAAERMTDRLRAANNWHRESAHWFQVSSLSEVFADVGVESMGLLWDWSSIGSYRTCLAANVFVDGAASSTAPDTFDMTAHYTMRDVYDWHPSAGPTDLGLDKLPAYGMARVYAMEGTVRLVVKWRRMDQLTGASYKAQRAPTFTLDRKS